MRAPDHGRVLEFPGTALEHIGKSLKILRNDLRCLANEQRLRGIDDIVRGQTVVKPAGVWSDDLGNGRGEGNDVVADFRFDLVDTLNPEVGALFDCFGGVFRNQAGFSQGFGGCDFDGKPGAEAVFVAPDAGHFRPGIARDHGRAPRSG
jgi:hypothetical protein